jgi:hypothetical protein
MICRRKVDPDNPDCCPGYHDIAGRAYKTKADVLKGDEVEATDMLSVESETGTSFWRVVFHAGKATTTWYGWAKGEADAIAKARAEKERRK